MNRVPHLVDFPLDPLKMFRALLSTLPSPPSLTEH